MFSSNVAFEELVLRSLKASPLIKPFLTPEGWQEVWSNVQESFCRFEVRSHVENGFFLKSFALIVTHVSRKVISLSEIRVSREFYGRMIAIC